MYSNIPHALSEIKDLLPDFADLSSEEKIGVCSNIVRIAEELRSCLDPKWRFHGFALEKLNEILNSAYNLWANAGISHIEDSRIQDTLDRILIAAIELESPTRWPSTCTFVDNFGCIVPGMNDPRPELAAS